MLGVALAGHAGRLRDLMVLLAQDRADNRLDLQQQHGEDHGHLGHGLKVAPGRSSGNEVAVQSRPSMSSIRRFISSISRTWAAMIESASSRTRGSAICARREVSTAIEWWGIIAFM